MMDKPNIVLLVFDALRYDYFKEYCELPEVIKNNAIQYERAITPAGWSLPAHASIFSGEYPSEHGITRVDDTFSDMELMNDLANQGYDTLAVSGNGFASPRYGFDELFNTYYSTHEECVFPEALDVREYIYDIKAANNGEFKIDIPRLMQSVKSSEGGVMKSVVNMAAAGISLTAKKYPSLSKIPLRRLQENQGFAHDPSKNTSVIRKIINNSKGDPFFLFSNYMNTHRPYYPAEKYQMEFFEEKLTLREIASLDMLAHPYKNAERVSRGDIPNKEIQDKIRKLYAAEACSVGDELNNIVNILNNNDILENTYIIITSDHGENLFEDDEYGRYRTGHWSSLSDNITHVPLIIYRPSSEPITHEDQISLVELPGIIRQMMAGKEISFAGEENNNMGIIYSEFPSAGREELLAEKYPDIPSEEIYREIVTAYKGKWKVIGSSQDDIIGINNGELSNKEDIPEDLHESVINKLKVFNHPDTEVTSDIEDHLEELGYI